MSQATATPVGEQGPVFERIACSSPDAGLVFPGMRPPQPDQTPEDHSRYCAELLRQTESMPATALVTANEKVDFRGISAAR